MAGVVLETLSSRKLLAFCCLLLIAQVACFLLGGLLAPEPYAHEDMLGNKCVDWDNQPDRWFYTRGAGNCTPIDDGQKALDFVNNVQKAAKRLGKPLPNASQIVFSFQYPLPRDNTELIMSPLFQEMLTVVSFDSSYLRDQIELTDNEITLWARLGYRDWDDKPGVWHHLASSRETRQLKCKLNLVSEGSSEGDYECEPQPLFSLGAVSHAQYLLNIRVPVSSASNAKIGLLRDISIMEFHQNGGFTFVWLGMKSAMFPLLCGLLLWHWRRVQAQCRRWTLLEQASFSLGAALSCLNCPIEWLSLTVLKAPIWLLVSDLRTGLFYCSLLLFWIVFTGEHTMDGGPKNRLTIYWKQLTAIGTAGICLLIFDLSERGVQIYNPFYTVWANPDAARFALASMIIAGVGMAAYSLLLLLLIVRALKGILDKRRHLPTLPEARRLFYTGAIARFCVFLAYTAVCAILSVAFYIVMELDESNWKWSEEGRKLEYSSAFTTGIYGMWNIYVCAIIILYAPSTKQMPEAGMPTDQANLFTTDSEQLQYQADSMRMQDLSQPPASAAPSEAIAFFTKQSAD